MSAGPIAAERASHRVPRASTPNVSRVCLAGPAGPAGRPRYCGRLQSRSIVSALAEVSCADCLAAVRADQEARA